MSVSIEVLPQRQKHAAKQMIFFFRLIINDRLSAEVEAICDLRLLSEVSRG